MSMRISDALLIRIALVVSVLGVSFLAVLFWTYSLPEVDSGDFDTLSDGYNIRLHGRVTSIQQFSSVTKITLESSCTVHAVSFEELLLTEGDEVIMEGEVTSYKGQKELLISRVIQ